MSESDFQPVRPSPYTKGRYVLDDHELTSSDIVEYQDGRNVLRARVEFYYDLGTYGVQTPTGGIIPLREISLARFLGRGREPMSAD